MVIANSSSIILLCSNNIIVLPGLGLFGPLFNPAGFRAGFGGMTTSGFAAGFPAGTRGLGFGLGAAPPPTSFVCGLGAGAGFEAGVGLRGTLCFGGVNGFSALGGAVGAGLNCGTAVSFLGGAVGAGRCGGVALFVVGGTRGGSFCALVGLAGGGAGLL